MEWLGQGQDLRHGSLAAHAKPVLLSWVLWACEHPWKMQPGDSNSCRQPHACVHNQHGQGHPGTWTSPRDTMLVLRGHSCLCQPWMVLRFQSVSAQSTCPRDKTRTGLQVRATLTRASGGSLGSSWGWQRVDPCDSICQQHLPQGGKAIRVRRMQSTL